MVQLHKGLPLYSSLFTNSHLNEEDLLEEVKPAKGSSISDLVIETSSVLSTL